LLPSSTLPQVLQSLQHDEAESTSTQDSFPGEPTEAAMLAALH